MKRALFLLLLLSGVAFGAAWTTFQPPDKSFRIQFPGKPDPSDKNETQVMVWSFGEQGKYSYSAGYFMFPGFGARSPQKQAELFEGLVKGLSKRMTNPKRKAGPDGAVDLEGTLANGFPTTMRVVSAPSLNRCFVLATLGQADTKRFFNSFKK